MQTFLNVPFFNLFFLRTAILVLHFDILGNFQCRVHQFYYELYYIHNYDNFDCIPVCVIICLISMEVRNRIFSAFQRAFLVL